MGKRERPKSYAMNDRKWFILYHLLTEVYEPLPPVTYEEYLKHVNQGERLHGSNLIKGDPTKDGLKKSIPEYIRHNDIAGIRSCVDDGKISLNGENVSDDTVRKMLLDWADKGFIKMGTKTNVRNLKYFFPDESRRGMDAFLDFLQGFGFDLEGRKALRNVSLVQTKYADVALTCDYVLYRLKKADKRVRLFRENQSEPIDLPYRGYYLKAFFDPRYFAEAYNRISLKFRDCEKSERKESEEFLKGLRAFHNLLLGLVESSEKLMNLINERARVKDGRPKDFDEGDYLTYLTPEEWMEYDPHAILRLEISHELCASNQEKEEIRNLIKDVCGEGAEESEIDRLCKDYWHKVSMTVSGILCMISHSFHALCYFNSYLNDQTVSLNLPSQPDFRQKSGNYEGIADCGVFIYQSNAVDPTKSMLYGDLEEELVRMSIYDLIHDMRSEPRVNSAFNCFGNVYAGDHTYPSTLSYRVGDWSIFTIESYIREAREYHEQSPRTIWLHHETVKTEWKGFFMPFTPLIECYRYFETILGPAKIFVGPMVYCMAVGGDGPKIKDEYFESFAMIHPEPPPSDHTYWPAAGYSKYKPERRVSPTVEQCQIIMPFLEKKEE